MFPETKSRETSELEGKNKTNWFPKGPDIKCIIYRPHVCLSIVLTTCCIVHLILTSFPNSGMADFFRSFEKLYQILNNMFHTYIQTPQNLTETFNVFYVFHFTGFSPKALFHFSLHKTITALKKHSLFSTTTFCLHFNLSVIQYLNQLLF